jgi:hypothetical protein
VASVWQDAKGERGINFREEIIDENSDFTRNKIREVKVEHFP